MIKEIVDIGRVSNKLGSVFTFKDLPNFYVEVILEWDGKDFIFILNGRIQKINDIEEYLEYGVHRGVTGDNKKYTFLFSSFLLDITSSPIKIRDLEKEIEKLKKDLDSKSTKTLIKSLNIKEKSLESENIKLLNDKKTFEECYKKGNEYTKRYLDKFRKKQLNICNENIKELSNTLSFMTKKEENIYIKNQKEKYKNKYSKTKEIKILKYIEKYQNTIHNSFDDIIKLAEECSMRIEWKQNAKKFIPIVVKVKSKNSEYYNYQKYWLRNLFDEVRFFISSNKIKLTTGSCNIYHDKKAEYFPKNFYYPYSTDKLNVKYNLNDDENLFVLSKEAYMDFIKGENFLEGHNEFWLIGLKCYVTATCINDEILKNFQNDVKEKKSDFDGLLEVVDRNCEKRYELLLNFYFWDYGQNSKEIIEYTKDVILSTLIRNVKLFEKFKDIYGKEFNRKLDKYSWQLHICYNIFDKNEYKKMRTALFRKIALNDEIDTSQLILFMNEKMQYDINKKYDKGVNKGKYLYMPIIQNFIFLNWVSKINKGESTMSEQDEQEVFVGKSYEEKLTYFLHNSNLVKDSLSMKIGVCVGLAIKILSWSINNYDKKSLAFVGKRIERNNLNSVQLFMNEIFSKTKFHEFESLQSVNIKLSTQELLKLENKTFNKDEFIFGLFLGNELYNNVKSDKDPTLSNNEEETTENDTTTTGEENE